MERLCNEIGWTVVEDDLSGLSESRYITIAAVATWEGSEALDLEGTELRIRISNHPAKPTYEKLHGCANYSVGTHVEAGTRDFAKLLAKISERGEGTPMPGRRQKGGRHENEIAPWLDL